MGVFLGLVTTHVTGMKRKQFKLRNSHLSFTLVWHISVMKQNSDASFCQVSGNGFTTHLEVLQFEGVRPQIDPWFILGSEVSTRDDHTSMNISVKHKHQGTCETNTGFFTLLNRCVMCHPPSPIASPGLPWTRRLREFTDYPFKTIDMGGVEQSHHQELIGPRLTFFITASPQWPADWGGDSEHKEVCQHECVYKWWQLKQGQYRSEWLPKKINRGCFLNTGLASRSCLPPA